MLQSSKFIITSYSSVVSFKEMKYKKDEFIQTATNYC
jgi:hypothetical protein